MNVLIQLLWRAGSREDRAGGTRRRLHPINPNRGYCATASGYLSLLHCSRNPPSRIMAYQNATHAKWRRRTSTRRFGHYQRIIWRWIEDMGMQYWSRQLPFSTKFSVAIVGVGGTSFSRLKLKTSSVVEVDYLLLWYSHMPWRQRGLLNSSCRITMTFSL